MNHELFIGGDQLFFYFKFLTFIFVVIMISGGYTNSKKVEIYDTRAKLSCFLPSMPTRRHSTVTKEVLVCGDEGGHESDCIIFHNGVWQNAHKLNQNRRRYVYV